MNGLFGGYKIQETLQWKKKTAYTNGRDESRVEGIFTKAE